MFGEGTTPGSGGPALGTGALDPDPPRGDGELRGDETRHPVGVHPLHLHVFKGALDGAAQPVADAPRVAGDLEALQVQVTRGADAGVVAAVAEPLHEERQLRVGLESL